MGPKKKEMITGGAIFAAITGVAYAGLQYKNRVRHNLYHRKYDPATVEEFSGRVKEVRSIGQENGVDKGVWMTVKSGKELNEVHLGPVWFIERQQKRFKAGEKVRVRGSRVWEEENSIIVAEMVIRGDNMLKLRDESGNPTWSAWYKNHR